MPRPTGSPTSRWTRPRAAGKGSCHENDLAGRRAKTEQYGAVRFCVVPQARNTVRGPGGWDQDPGQGTRGMERATAPRPDWADSETPPGEYCSTRRRGPAQIPVSYPTSTLMIWRVPNPQEMEMGLDESHPHTPWAGGHARSPVRDAAPDASTPPITVVTRRTGWGCRPGPWGDLVGGCGARRPQGVGEPPAHRRYRRDDGTTATYEAPGSWMPRRGDSPAANRRCASARSHGHEEDPPRALIIARRCPMRRRCVVSADRWQVARTPATRLIPESSFANTCPSRRHWNSSLGARRTTPCTRHASKSGVPPNAPEHHPLIRHHSRHR